MALEQSFVTQQPSEGFFSDDNDTCDDVPESGVKSGVAPGTVDVKVTVRVEGTAALLGDDNKLRLLPPRPLTGPANEVVVIVVQVVPAKVADTSDGMPATMTVVAPLCVALGKCKMTSPKLDADTSTALYIAASKGVLLGCVVAGTGAYDSPRVPLMSMERMWNCMLDIRGKRLEALDSKIAQSLKSINQSLSTDDVGD
jgi:hypothetical protein